MQGKVEKIVVDWFDKYHPDWWGAWIDSEFDAYEKLPCEIKMVPAFKFLEHNIIKGGWPQFLWNGFGSWRELINIVRQGYGKISATPEIFSALDNLESLCDHNELQCEREIDGDSNFGSFIDNMRQKYTEENTQWEMELWSGTDIFRKRLAWLDQNEALILRLLDDEKNIHRQA